MPNHPLILTALREPASLVELDLPAWDRLLREARVTGALPRLAARLDRAGVVEQLPAKVRDHLEAGRAVVEEHRRVAMWEVNRIRRALLGESMPIVLLKGAAYIAADLPPAQGRTVSDVDIMTPKEDIFRVEKLLKQAGWQSMKLHAYDQRYYRKWMHELPPMRHADRQAVLDVHHTILPESGRLKPSAAKLFDALRIVLEADAGKPAVRILAPADMLLHSAAHLFQDGEIAGGLRDLLDLDELLRHFGEHEPGFYDTLVARAVELDLHRPLYYALRFTTRLLATPVPPGVLDDASKAGKPSWPIPGVMTQLVERALLSHSSRARRFGTNLACLLLYIRSHWLRMPPLLLARHLTRKAFRRFMKDEDEQGGAMEGRTDEETKQAA